MVDERLGSDVRQMAEGHQLPRGELEGMGADIALDLRKVKALVRLSHGA
jgi:hypothetical protein